MLDHRRFQLGQMETLEDKKKKKKEYFEAEGQI